MSFTDFDGADGTRACTRKKAYASERIARQSITSIRASYPDADVRPYACRRCGQWHVGGTPRDYDGPTFSDPDAISKRDVGFTGRRDRRDRRLRSVRRETPYSRPRRGSPRRRVEEFE